MLSLFYFQQKKDARIIVGMFYEDQARKVFCEVTSCQNAVCFFTLGMFRALPYLFYDTNSVSCWSGFDAD